MKAEIIAEILDRGRDDWVDLAEVMSVVRSRTSLAEPAVIALSVEIIGDMLDQHCVMVGDLQKQGDKVLFSPWDGRDELIIARVKRDIAALGHRPGIGEVCWLSTM